MIQHLLFFQISKLHIKTIKSNQTGIESEGYMPLVRDRDRKRTDPNRTKTFRFGSGRAALKRFGSG